MVTNPKTGGPNIRGKGPWKAEQFLRRFSDQVAAEYGESSGPHILAVLSMTSLRDCRREIAAASDGVETEFSKQLLTQRRT
jgi:hypothetical protein